MSDTITCLSQLREANPLVHCMTNTVVPQITANVLLAVGAAPAMIDHPSEAGLFAQIASGMLINVGNGLSEQHQGMRVAAASAKEAGTPWVLDPVAVGALPVRTELAMELLQFSPTAIRGNASEIAAVAGSGAGGRGVDATDSVEDVVQAARQLAERTSAVVAVSGPTDVIVSGQRTTRVVGGHELMPLVIGTGCSLGAVVAACLGAIRDTESAPHDAAVAAHALFAAAGKVAGEVADAPAAFDVAWRDLLYRLTPQDVAELVIIEEV